MQRHAMDSYIKSTLKSKPERIIIHYRTNDLKNNTPQSIADISSSAKSGQQENDIVPVSSTVPTKDHLDK